MDTVDAVVVGAGVTLVDSGEATAQVVADLLDEKGLRNMSSARANVQFFVSDIPHKFAEVGERFLGERLGRVRERRRSGDDSAGDERGDAQPELARNKDVVRALPVAAERQPLLDRDAVLVAIGDRDLALAADRLAQARQLGVSSRHGFGGSDQQTRIVQRVAQVFRQNGADLGQHVGCGIGQ